MRAIAQAVASEENRALWAWLAAMLLSAIFIPAGGLGLAAAAGLYALIALPAQTVARHFRRPALATVLTIAALGWMTATHFWSPYRNPDEVLKLALLTPFFILVPVAASRIGPLNRRLAQTGLILCVGFTLMFMLVEYITGGDMTLGYKLAVEGYDAGRTDLDIRVNKVLSRGATPAIMLAGIAVILLWTQLRLGLKIVAAIAGLITVLVALGFGVHANAVALAAALILTVIAGRWPALTLRCLLAGLGVFVLAGPLVFAVLLSFFGPELSAAMPMSWEWRVEIWRFALERISEAPLAGHGFGAARVLDGSMQLRGYEIDLLPLHAHNASLTIWLETGFVGAGLCAAVLIALARAVPATLQLPARTMMMIVFAVTIWAVNVVFSYGIWQEWHHGALALSIAAAFISRPQS